jgi:hypothetical protein
MSKTTANDRSIRTGQVWNISGNGDHYGPLGCAGEVRVMCVAEKYAMVRRKGAMPFVLSFSDMHRFCSLVTAK